MEDLVEKIAFLISEMIFNPMDKQKKKKKKKKKKTHSVLTSFIILLRNYRFGMFLL